MNENNKKNDITGRIRMRLDKGWHMKDVTWNDFIPAQVPGDMYSDLIRAGKMEDPYYRDNELNALKLSGNEYLYENRFDVSPDFLSHDAVILEFEGIDTLADVLLNGKLLGQTDNMHRTWRFQVKEHLQGSGNILQVLFHSPTAYIREKYEENVLDGTEDAMCGFPYLRKAHCMFGWDWGPRLPGCGIFRPVILTAYDAARIDSVYIRQRHEDGNVYITADVKTQAFKDCDIACRVEVSDPQEDVVCEGIAGREIKIENPRLWYPAGFGTQPLYTIRLSLIYGEHELDCREMRIGLRTMTVARHKDEFGESFAHCVNGLEIFAMGADYIPEDCLISRTSPERTRRLLEDARRAHFNCIRVWGGGYYPEDWFYDICDELGLIVWQDFMFACAVYDLTEDFESNIRTELTDNIKRIRHHACLGLWCGNNEMELFVDQGEWVNSPKEKSDYIKMYEYIFPKLLKELDPQTFYWPASPSSGGNFDNPNDETRGDVHYWDVWHGSKPFTEYRKFHFRYLSEFGFQSFPSVKTIEAFTLPRDRNPYSYVMEKHQRNASANGKIANYMSQTYLYPSDFEMFVYASQLLQAQAIRYGVEHFRRWRGRCMGTVIWQLNDCWPVASWSSIDYYGRWKALHYYAARFFAPVLLSCEEEGILTQNTNPNAQPYEVKKSVRFNVCNETVQDHRVLIVWMLADSEGKVKLKKQEAVEVKALSALWLEKEDLPQADLYEDHVSYMLIDMDQVPEDISGVSDLVSYRSLESGVNSSISSVLFCPPKYYHFKDPQLSYRIEGDEIVIACKAFAKDIAIQNTSDDLLLSDNYFDMEPGEKRVRILRGEPVGLWIRSTYDIA